VTNAPVLAAEPGRQTLQLSREGRLEGVRFVASPNADDRPDGEPLRLLVVHGISLPPRCFGGDAVLRLFANALDGAEHPDLLAVAQLRVSAHFLVRRSGEIVQFVECRRRAWHAGASCWRGRERCNDFSIGVELEGADDVEYTQAQYRALGGLGFLLAAAYPLEDVVGHSDIAPGRKTDPGPAFDWRHARALLPQLG
jgi:AmpD protein